MIADGRMSVKTVGNLMAVLGGLQGRGGSLPQSPPSRKRLGNRAEKGDADIRKSPL